METKTFAELMAEARGAETKFTEPVAEVATETADHASQLKAYELTVENLRTENARLKTALVDHLGADYVAAKGLA